MLVHLSGREVKQAIIEAAMRKAHCRKAAKLMSALFVPAAGQVNPLNASAVVQIIKVVRVRA